MLPGWLKLGCLLQPGCAQGLDTTLIMPGSLCVQQNRPRALPGWWKLGCRIQPSNAQCRLVTLTMPWCLCFPARVASLLRVRFTDKLQHAALKRAVLAFHSRHALVLVHPWVQC